MNSAEAICVVTSLCSVALIGCHGPYEMDFQYRPSPAALVISAPPATHAAPVTVLATVLGVRSAHAPAHPLTIEIRLRVENNASVVVALDPASLGLAASDLSQFGTPSTEPASPLTVQPGEAANMTIWFPMKGHQDLQSLVFRWTLSIGDQPYSRTVLFTGRWSGYDRPKIYDWDDDEYFFSGQHYHDHNRRETPRQYFRRQRHEANP